MTKLERVQAAFRAWEADALAKETHLWQNIGVSSKADRRAVLLWELHEMFGDPPSAPPPPAPDPPTRFERDPL